MGVHLTSLHQHLLSPSLPLCPLVPRRPKPRADTCPAGESSSSTQTAVGSGLRCREVARPRSPARHVPAAETGLGAMAGPGGLCWYPQVTPLSPSYSLCSISLGEIPSFILDGCVGQPGEWGRLSCPGDRVSSPRASGWSHGEVRAAKARRRVCVFRRRELGCAPQHPGQAPGRPGGEASLQEHSAAFLLHLHGSAVGWAKGGQSARK